MHLGENSNVPIFKNKDFSELHIVDKWIITKLHQLIKDFNTSMENYEYLKAARDIRTFYWNVFCDWYIEASKTRVYSSNDSEKLKAQSTLLYVLETSLKLLHPFIPHITEVLWQHLPDSIKSDQALIVAKWPEVDVKLIDDESEKLIDLMVQTITEIRRVRSDFNVPLGAKIPLIFDTPKKEFSNLFESVKDELVSLAKIDSERFIFKGEENPKNSARIILEDLTVYIPLADIINREAEYKRIKKQATELEKQIFGLKTKLEGPFATKASPDIVAKEKERWDEMSKKLQAVNEQLDILS